MNWHYAENGQHIGPVTDEQLRQLFQAGKINADTLVWHEGLPDWKTYHEAAPDLAPAPLAPGQSPAAATPRNPNEAVCAECGAIFPISEMVPFGNARVCANCKPAFLQKLSEGARINTGELNYAGFWIRFAAKLVDGVILGVPFVIVYLIAIFPMITSAIHNENKPPSGMSILFFYLIQFGFMIVRMFYEIFFLGKYGATPGKMVCRLKVVTAEGGKISYLRATGRFFSEILSGMICYIGYIMVAFDDQKRGLHDHICNTRVIQKEQ